jgi:hypothetical protein
VRNLCAIGGDASTLLNQRLKAESIGSIFINHPEPPVQRGSTRGTTSELGDDSYGRHLLTTVLLHVTKVCSDNNET